MVSGYRYRATSVVGTVLASVLAVLLANLPIVQTVLTTLPPARRLPTRMLTGDELTLAVATTAVVVVGTLVPLFKPRPRRILDTVLLVQKRVVVAGLALAAIGYFDYTYRLPRTTLTVTVVTLFVALPAWFVLIRRPPFGGERGVVVGDDPEEIHNVLEAADVPLVGYVSPPSPYFSEGESTVGALTLADGSGRDDSVDAEYLGGLSRFDEVLVEHDIDTAILAFAKPDRAEFFGALDICYEHGLKAKVHRDYADNVLADSTGESEELIDVDLEPWDWQDYVFKRAFDVGFATVGLVAFAPLIGVIALAIKLDSPGPVLYSQERTAEFGETFEVYKFRSMVLEGESAAPTADEDNDRITRVGRVLRRTHLDEIPQLWAILTGKMSVVGPRAVWTDEESLLEASADTWRKRWFVKPGLTGLAQIQNASSTEPEEKLWYDLEYIRRQSFWFDVKIVIRQVWKVIYDVHKLIENR